MKIAMLVLAVIAVASVMAASPDGSRSAVVSVNEQLTPERGAPASSPPCAPPKGAPYAPR
jgi:hypothetical protein